MTTLLANNGEAGCFFAFVIAAIVIAAIIFGVKASRAMKAGLARLAQRLGGTFIEGGFLQRPSVEFRLAGRRARFEFYSGSKNSPPYSRLEIGLTDRIPGTLHILPQGFGQGFLNLFGAQDLEVGDARFDSEYVLKAKPESLVARVFSPERRDKVMASVRRVSNFRHPTIDLEGSQLRVQIREYCYDDQRLMALVHTAEDFLKYLFGAPAPAPEPGIEWGELRAVEGGECPVCSTVMKEGVIHCEACRTPHHLECWEYAGKCSTFGCAGKRAVL